jgi:hypothetical protein
MTVARERIGKHVHAETDSGPCRGVTEKTIWDKEVSSVRKSVKKRVSWKGAAIHSGLELGS